MKVPQAFVNGNMLPASQCSVPVYDNGFVLGVTVAEQQRTFGGKIFRLDHHLKRLFRSLEIVGVEIPWTRSELSDIARELISNNFELLDPNADMGLCIFVTPGPETKFVAGDRLLLPDGLRPMVCMHTYPLDFRLWSNLYIEGQPLVIPAIREVPLSCWPRELKCRSRMHYYLADREARSVDPHARALLLDMEGFIAEASTASVLMVTEREGLVAPKSEKVLPSISVAVIEELAAELEIPFSRRDISPDEISSADEVLLCSTSPCILPVSSIDGRKISSGQPGAIFDKLINAWSEIVGVDIRRQASLSVVK